jgi:transposase
MRGNEAPQVNLFSYVHLEDRIPRRHPLRSMRRMVDQALAGLDGAFAAMYATTGRPSVPPERMLRALLLQIVYSIRSEALLIEQLDYNLLFRWFVGLGIDEPVWDPSTFSKNRDRLIEAEVAQGVFEQVLAQAAAKDLLSDEHFSIDGTLLETWASQKSGDRHNGRPMRGVPGSLDRAIEVGLESTLEQFCGNHSGTDLPVEGTQLRPNPKGFPHIGVLPGTARLLRG